MKKLNFLFVIFVALFVTSSVCMLQADEPNVQTPIQTEQPVSSNSTTDGSMDIPQEKKSYLGRIGGFFKKAVFWKGDSEEEEVAFKEEEITDEDIDPRLKKERSKPIEIRIRDKYRIKVDTLKSIESNMTVLSNLDKDTQFVVPLDEEEKEIYIEEYYDREAPLLMSRLDTKTDIDIYQETYFNNFSPMARVKMIFKNISEQEILGYGSYIGANLVIMRKFYEPSIGNYVYDIMFLRGNTKDRSLYWFRNAQEAIPLSESLSKMGISDLNDYLNLIKFNMINPERTVYMKLTNNYNKKREEQILIQKSKLQEEESQLTGQTVTNNTRLQNILTSEVDSENSMADSEDFLLQNLTDEEIYELQKNLISFRVNKLVGIWEDIHTGEAIEIRELPKDKDENNTNYGAYAILNEDFATIKRFSVDSDSNVESTDIPAVTPLPVNPATENEADLNLSLNGNQEDTPLLESSFLINKSLSWLSQDLKFQFESKGGQAFFLDDEKMVKEAKVYLHPAKGLIVVSLPNNQYRYYRPVILDLFQALEEGLYDKDLYKETIIDPSNMPRYSNQLTSTPGVDNYFLYPGITLGFLALILVFIF